MSDESFIPWEQIEPLLVEGMTGSGLTAAIIRRLGLPPGYGAITAVGGIGGIGDMPYRDALRYGLRIVKRDSDLWRACVRTSNDEPVR